MQPEPEHVEPDMKPYVRLAVALMLSFVVMFVSGYARTNVWDNVYLNLNRLYMTSLMVAPMALIMLATMPSMFKSKRLNVGLVVASVALTALFWGLVRTQGGVGDRQFLRSMIPHHAAAVLVCEEASLSDPRIRTLCGQIIESQQREIREMKGLLGAAE